MSAGLWTQCVTTLNETQQKAIQDLLNTAWAQSPAVSPLFRNTSIKTRTLGSLHPPSGRWPQSTLLSNSIYTERNRGAGCSRRWEDIQTPTTNESPPPHSVSVESGQNWWPPPWRTEEHVVKLDINHYLCVQNFSNTLIGRVVSGGIAARGQGTRRSQCSLAQGWEDKMGLKGSCFTSSEGVFPK